jgi:hypothetical protein
MSEPMPDTSWRVFLAERLRRLDELDIAYNSATWWEREAMKDERARLYYDIDIAMRHVDDEQVTTDEVPW